MQCPQCGQQLEPWDTQCPRCARSGQQAPAPPSPYPQPNFPQPPIHSASPGNAAQPAWSHTLGRYQSPTGIATGLCILLGIQVVTNAVSGLLNLALAGMKPIIRGAFVQPADTMGVAGLFGLVFLLSGAVYIATVVVWCIWKYRTHWNIAAFGARELQFAPGWSVGWYFVPFLQLIRPYQAMEEIWKASDPNVDLQDGTEWRNGSVPSVVSAWWMAFLIPLVVAIVAGAATYNSNDPSQSWATQNLIRGLHFLAFTLDAVLAILVVRQLSARQEEKYQRLYNAYYSQPQQQPYPTTPQV